MNKPSQIKNFCRMCKGTNLEEYLDLGHHPPSDEFLTPQQLNEKTTIYPLKVILCLNCGLSQLSYVINPSILFQQNYPYDSSTTITGTNHYHQMAKDLVLQYQLKPNDLVVDIGSNVGVLLDGFQKQHLQVAGIDPAATMAEIANQNGIYTLCDFFSPESAKKILKQKGPAALITATNVFAHVDDLDEFLNGIKVLLKEDGLFVIESPYMIDLVDRLAYDTIYHEHLSYLSVKPLITYLQQFDLQIIDIKRVPIHGGSFRLFISKKGTYKVKPIVKDLLNLEIKKQIHSLQSMQKFATRVKKNRDDLRYLLTKIKHQKKSIAALSAPAKGMTLLNYCKIGTETIDFATEKNPLKIGKYTPGGHIPIFSDKTLQTEKPDYALLLAWNFAPEIMSNLQSYANQGGKFIIPLPSPYIK